MLSTANWIYVIIHVNKNMHWVWLTGREDRELATGDSALEGWTSCSQNTATSKNYWTLNRTFFKSLLLQTVRNCGLTVKIESRWTLRLTYFFLLPIFLPWPDVSRAMVMWPPSCMVTDHLTEQTRTNMSQPGRRRGTAVGDERHVLQALWSRKDI